MKANTSNIEIINIEEDFGCAGNCVQTAKVGALMLTSDTEDTSLKEN